MITLLLNLTFLTSLTAFCALRLRTYLHPYQQEEYDPPRLYKWWVEKRAFDRWATLGLLPAFALSTSEATRPYAPLVASAWLGYRCWAEPNPTRGGKKPLILTSRAKSLWLTSTALTFILAAVISPFILAAIVLIQFLPALLAAATYMLAPVQARQNTRYLKEAHTILQRLNPTIVGLTGSFGKTSTKYILAHLLSAHKPTLMTPGSVNTPLGIARVVREQLRPQHTYFLAEMGAYGPGSIARLCHLAPPTLSCITAVGHAHYERFKSLETVAKAKFEIAEAAQRNGGRTVLSIDGIPTHLWLPYVEASPHSYRLVSTHTQHLREDDFHITHAEQTAKGLALTLRHKGEETSFQTPIFGTAQIGNLGAAFAMAVELGLSKKAIARAMATAPAAPHRLAVSHEGQLTTIDDSYNANPTGFASALEVLTLIAHAPGKQRRRILITPGMVELGEAHAEQHTRLGTLAAHGADVILAITPGRMPTFMEAARTGSAEVVELPTLAAARKWLSKNGRPDDVLLLENDLPDRYETAWKL